MKICSNQSEPAIGTECPKFVAGHVYHLAGYYRGNERHDYTGPAGRRLYLATASHERELLFGIHDGIVWSLSDESPFGERGRWIWRDVTDLVCIDASELW